MGAAFWIPVVVISFYAHFSFQQDKNVGIAVMILTTIISCFISFKVSGMTAMSWFYEILMCGVNKLSMSITSLSGPTPETRTWWMPVFEVYFGLCIKFVNPAILTYMIFEFIS